MKKRRGGTAVKARLQRASNLKGSAGIASAVGNGYEFIVVGAAIQSILGALGSPVTLTIRRCRP
jgi:hypothetical protein